MAPVTGHLAQIPQKIGSKISGHFKYPKGLEPAALLFCRIQVNHFGIFIYIYTQYNHF